MSRPFPLRYPAECGMCDDFMPADTMARFGSDGEIVHDCPDRGERITDHGTCPDCWTRKTITGACLCEAD